MHLNLSSPRLAVFNVMTLRWLCVCLQSAAVPAALLCFILVCLGGLGVLDVPTPTTSPDVTAGQTTTSGQAAKEAAQHSIKASTVLEDGVAQFLQRWPAVRLEHHNLKPSDMVHYNITCKPKVWLLLSLTQP